MEKLVRVRASVNCEKRDMLNRGTSYRTRTAIYSSRLLNDLVSSNQTRRLTQKELSRFAKEKLKVDAERAADVAKNIHVHLKSIDDQSRLANYYKRADELLNIK